MTMFYIRNISSYGNKGGRTLHEGLTYANDGRIIGHGWRLVLLDVGMILNPQVFYVTAAEHDVLVDLVGGSNLLFRSTLATLGTE